MSENLKDLLKGTDTFEYYITYTDSKTSDNPSSVNYYIEPQIGELSDIVNDASSLNISKAISSSLWESDINKGDKYYNLHIERVDGTPLTQDEHDFITSLIKNKGGSTYQGGGEIQEGDRVIITTKSLGKQYDGMTGEVTSRKLLNDKYSIKLENGLTMAFEKGEFRHDTTYPNYSKGGSTYQGGGETDSWEEEALNEIRSHENDDTIDIEYEEDNHITVESETGAEYMIFKSEEDARDYAINRVKEDLENEPELFTESWLIKHIDEDKAKDFFKGVYKEWGKSYAEDIRSELDDEYDNRLISEMVEYGIMSEEEATSNDADSIAEDRIDEFAQAMTDNKIEEGNGGYEHYKDNFTDEEARKLIIDNDLIDIDEASKDAVNVDGVAHFISTYDGEEISLGGNGFKAYRIN